MTPKEKIEALYGGIAFFYPGLVYGPDAPTNDQDKIEYEGRTVSKKEFLNIVFEFTKTNDINLALKKLLELRETIDEIRPEEQPDRTAPENLEELVEQKEKQKAEEKKQREKRQREQKVKSERVKKEQVQIPVTKEQEKEIVDELQDKVVYAEPKDTTQKVQATPEDEYALKKLTESAIDRTLTTKNRRVFVTKLSEQIVKNAPPEIKEVIPPEQLELSAKQIALDFSERLINKTPVAPPGVFASIADPAANLEKIISSPLAVNQIHEDGVVFTALSERSDFTTRTLLYPVLGENVTSLVYGPAQATYTVTFEPTDKTAYTVNLSELHENATDFQSGPVYQSLNNPLLDIAKDKLFSFGKEKILSKFNILPKGGAFGFISRFSSSGTFDSAISLLARSQTQYVASKISGKIVMALLPTHTRIIVGISNFINFDLGLIPIVSGAAPTTAVTTGILTTKALAAGAAKPVAAKIAGGAVSTAIGKGVTAVAIKLGLSATLAQTLGTVLPIIGHAIGFVLGTLVQKLAGWLKKNPDTAIGVGAAVLVGGLLVQSPVLIIGGAAALAVGGFARGALTVGVVAGGILLFGRRLGKSLAITVGLPIIIMIAITPIIVYFILFIINSGAYMVPPSPPGLNFESPYIRVDKVANPPGPFQNSDLPLTIEYTITITAKKGTLTNIHFSENCQVIKKGAAVNCPSITGGIPQPPDSISPATPFSFKYSVTYAAGTFDDSLVVNSFTVTADAAEARGVKTVGSTSIKIGNPPEDCPNNAWPIEGNGGLNAVTQGPSAPGCTHQNLNNAIDIGVDGATVVAVHSGIVTVGDDSCVGKYIKISSTCGSVPFSSLYGHLGAVTVSTGQKVSVGQAIGINDNTGSCTSGPHLHFEFKTSSIPKVQKPYLIRDIPIGCCTISTCNP